MSTKDNKNILILAGVVAAVVIVGAIAYSQQKQTKTVSINVGGKKISASVSE